MTFASMVASLRAAPEQIDRIDAVIDAAIHSGPADEDVAEFADLLGRSGDLLPPNPGATDIASTGGPGSLTTLLSPLQCRAAGMEVRKVTVPGRPAGSIDVLGCVPGYSADLAPDEALLALSRSGYVQLMAGKHWAPLDSRIFTRRQELNAQAVAPLVIGSILAKKVCAGLSSFALDVRVAPYGNFGKSVSEAAENVGRLTSVASLLGIEARCCLSDGAALAQPYVGRGEALLALDALTANADVKDQWLTEHARECQSLAHLATGIDLDPAPQRVRAALLEHLTAQGATAEAWTAAVARVRSHPTFEIRALDDGLAEFDIGVLRTIIVNIQRRRSSPSAAFSDPVGVVLNCRPGQSVRRREPLAAVRIAPGVDGVDRILEDFRSAIGIERPGGS